MSADSTELTFVRCPSCRSLVPAMSKSCRMCGATLDASAKVEEIDGGQRRSGRVRQRTMSQGQDELSATANKIREEMASQAEAPVSAVTENPASVEPPLDDPLSAFVQEIEVSAEPAPVANGSQITLKNGRSDVAETMLVDNDLDALLSGEKRATTEPEAVVPARAPEQESTPKVVIENGGRRQKGGLSFSKPREELRQAMEEPSQPEERRDFRRDDRRDQNARSPQTATPQAAIEKSQDKIQWSEVPRKSSAAGKLCGWFVSFKDPEGRSIELREGKYFISSRQIKGNDLVLDDRSISSPHALLALTGDGKMRAQDMMSDRGVFVKHVNENEYVQASESFVELRHGDWIKFGDVEFQLCLIAHVGQK